MPDKSNKGCQDMKRIVTVIAFTAFATTAFAQSGAVTPQSPADAKKEQAAVAKEAKSQASKATKPAAPKAEKKAKTTTSAQ